MSFMVRPARIELAPAPWQGAVLPLNYGRNAIQFVAPNDYTYFCNYCKPCAPAKTRTWNLLVRSQALYPLSYGGTPVSVRARIVPCNLSYAKYLPKS